MIPDVELERQLTEVWRRFMSAAMTKDGSAYAVWREWKELSAQRTDQQRARALQLAGLNADGTPVDNGQRAKL